MAIHDWGIAGSRCGGVIGMTMHNGKNAVEKQAVGRSSSVSPLFALPSGTGDVAYAIELSRHLDADVPVHALSWPDVMPASLDALAAHMVDLMRSVQPHGPYRLLGHSSGGLLAYATGQLLAEVDAPVDFIGLIDCAHPTIPPSPAAPVETMWRDYLAQPLPARSKLHLFHAAGDAAAPQPLAWDRLLPREQIAVVPVPETQGSMIEAPNIGKLGRAVSQALREVRVHAIRAHAPALVLQGGRGVPIVCVPGAGDSITAFVDFSIALGTNQALIGMQPRGVDGCSLPYGSVEVAAAAYLAAMRPHIPLGAPVHLLGHSFGGWVVFEMARQLPATGVKVASLTLIDTEAPDHLPGIRDDTRHAVVDRFLEALALRTPTPLPIDASSLRDLDAQALIEALHRLMVNLGLMPARSKPDALRGPFYSFARACRTRYCPDTRYDAPVNLVLVRDTRLDTDADASQRQRIEQQWRVHAPALQVWHGPGNHMTVLRPPNVSRLVDWWRSTLLGSTDSLHGSGMAPVTPLIN
jgi:thioesterase domain-containing protein